MSTITRTKPVMRRIASMLRGVVEGVRSPVRRPGDRRQSAVIPYRWSQDRVEVLLITRRGRREWIVPKGNIEPGMSGPQSAAKEAEEEAGVKGRPSRGRVGAFMYTKRGATLVVDVYDLEVRRELDAWPERGQRRRQWVSVSQAVALVHNPQLRQLIRTLRTRATRGR